MASKKPMRQKSKPDKYAFLSKIDIRDTPAISELSIRDMRQMASLNNIQLPGTCSTKQDILYSIHTYVEKLHGKDYNLSYNIKPNVASEKLDQINKAIEKNVSNNNIYWEEAKKLCQMMCTSDEIRGFFGVSYDTLNDKRKAEWDFDWPEFYELHSANGRIAIRRAQLKMALDKEKPNVSMLIHLGKTVLGQVESKADGKGTVPDGVLTIESLVDFLSVGGMLSKDVMKDTAAQDSAYAETISDDQDEAFRQRAAEGDRSQNAGGGISTGASA